jgi:hypothetical protein
MIRNVPVDTAALLANVHGCLGIDPVVDYDTGEHKKNRDGVPRYKAVLVYQLPGRKRDLIEIGFAASEVPVQTSAEDEIILQGLVVRHWSSTNEYGHSSGMSLSADVVGFKPAAARSNGQRETAAA